MRRTSLLYIVLILVLLVMGCDDSIDFSVTDIEGSWDFPDQGGYTEIDVFVLTGGDGADIAFTYGSDSYFCYGGGTYEDGVLTGTYDSNLNDNAYSVEDQIIITYSLDDGKLSFSCTGEGPLHGKSFTQGVLADS